MILPKFYSHPRCGVHFVTELVWRNLFSHHIPNRLELIGGHALENMHSFSIVIIRQPEATMKSVWNMRERFGLTGCKTYKGFLNTPYRDQFVATDTAATTVSLNVPTRQRTSQSIDPFFASSPLRPRQFYRAYLDQINLLRLARFDFTHFRNIKSARLMLTRIASNFDEIFVPKVIDMVDQQVGWNIRDDWEKPNV